MGADRCADPTNAAINVTLALSPPESALAGKRSGQPCICGLRITVWDLLSRLAAGMSVQETLNDYPELEPADFPAVYDFAAQITNG